MHCLGYGGTNPGFALSFRLIERSPFGTAINLIVLEYESGWFVYELPLSSPNDVTRIDIIGVDRFGRLLRFATVRLSV